MQLETNTTAGDVLMSHVRVCLCVLVCTATDAHKYKAFLIDLLSRPRMFLGLFPAQWWLHAVAPY